MLSLIKGIFSCQMKSEEEKLHGVHSRANNNQSESSFGSLSEQSHDHGYVGFQDTGGVAMSRLNGDFYHDNSTHE